MEEFSDFANMLGGGDSAFWQEPDFLLSSLVSLMANKLDSEIGITLMVKGMMLTGTLVGEREYLNAINTMFKSIAKNAIATPSKDELKMIDEAFIFNELTEDVYDDEDEEEPEDDDEEGGDEDEEDFGPEPPAEIRHLHIKDPMFIYSQSSLSFSESPLPIMRIRLTAVDGWMMGRMTVVPMDDDDDDDLPMPFTGIRH
jgi:hypothetical protein